MGKRTGVNQPRPRYGVTPQAFIVLAWLVMLAMIALAAKLLQWLTF